MRLLAAGGIVVPDLPPEWRYGIPSYERLREDAARLSFEMGLGDRVAWEAGFEDDYETRFYGLRLALAESRKKKARGSVRASLV